MRLTLIVRLVVIISIMVTGAQRVKRGRRSGGDQGRGEDGVDGRGNNRPNPCESVNCRNGGKCVRGICECTCGYSGPDCGVDSCNNRCLNNATCNNGICDCPPMFSGKDCGTKIEPVDLCENITCSNNGQCVSGICKCTPGYHGDDCNTNPCEITDCPGETTRCVPIQAPGGGLTCSCVKRNTISPFGDKECFARSIITPLQTYDTNLNVITNIPGVPGKNLTISFIDDFSITFLPPSCSTDYLEIDGTRYCGGQTPADITLSTGADAQVRFVTGSSGGSEGYTLTYQYIDAVPDTSNHCKNGGTLTTQQTCNCREEFQGANCEFPPIITSGGRYQFNQDTTFTLPGFPQKELVLTFDGDFSVETTGGNCNDILRNNCGTDYVEIEETRYCGGGAPGPITIFTGTGTTVRFVSGGFFGGCPTGFTLTYVYRDP
ncbi:hypothetical protein SNE40_017491 [Patella caerulea]|uniref:Uncharacterized protein n=1 Tax=Patella caerulea TaxID=87958 RepID=A0AAN8PFX5_PATCE